MSGARTWRAREHGSEDACSAAPLRAWALPSCVAIEEGLRMSGALGIEICLGAARVDHQARIRSTI